MARRRASASSSLDLLLDTITNTLGGVLFLALLLVLLTRASRRVALEDGPEVSRDVAAHQAVLEETADVQHAIDRLASEHRQLSSVVSSLLAASTSGGTLQAVNQKTARIEALRNEVEVHAEAVESLQGIVAAAERRLDELQADRIDVQAEVARLRKQLEQLRAERADDLPLAREGRTRLSPAVVMIRYGRLYFPRRSTPGDSRSPNTEDFFDLGVDDTAGQQRRELSPKPWRGILILRNGKITAEARSAIAAWPPEQHYLDGGVWDDSFAEAYALRKHLVQHGYRYRWLPVTEGDTIYESATADVTVQ